MLWVTADPDDAPSSGAPTDGLIDDPAAEVKEDTDTKDDINIESTCAKLIFEALMSETRTSTKVSGHESRTMSPNSVKASLSSS